MTTYRAHNGYDQAAASDEATIFDDTPSLTIQSQAEDADINVLMRRYGITGKMPDNVKIPVYGDFTHISDYRGALNAVKEAHENFMTIPAEIRARFDNDPQNFLEFAADPRNMGTMVELGLAKVRHDTNGTANQPPGTNNAQTATGTQPNNSPTGGSQAPPSPPK